MENSTDFKVSTLLQMMREITGVLTELELVYGGGEEWDPDRGYLFTADSTSQRRERLAQQVHQASGADQAPLHQRDLSECIAASRTLRQTEWVLKMKMPDEDKHVMFCISFCDGAIPEPPIPYNDPLNVHLDI